MGGSLVSLLPILLMFVIFYFLLIRPNQKRQKAVQQMQASLKKGDKVVTIGGLHGTIEAIEENTVVIRCHNATLTFDRNAIRQTVEQS
ncbi:preprotein translocase subunit YajC [Fictibacillus sp. Mic-4]|uniref:preprotein translocase subunit YajC n=1 Tax=Fictibacillus TaxID=1329200 RepID=UPI0004032DDC|nr:preprotein translocase subunit YajC [Fictibacillus gelatini]